MRGIATSARTIRARACCGTPRARSSATIPIATTCSRPLSYVTGSHNVKVGVLYQWGIYRRYNNANADLYQTYNNGVPLQVTVLNTPLAGAGEPRRQLRRLRSRTRGTSTPDDQLRPALRLRSSRRIVGQDAQVGRFANSPAYDDIVLPTWSDFSPRLSVVYDILRQRQDGRPRRLQQVRDGADHRVRTALQPDGAHDRQNLPWTDLNGDDIAQGERGCTYLTAGCEINFANLPANFGVRSLAQFDPDIKRPYSMAFNARRHPRARHRPVA